MSESSRRGLRVAYALAALVAVSALSLSGCAGVSKTAQSVGASGTPVQGGTLTVAAPGDPRSFDPVASPGPLTDRYSELMYEGLFASDKNFVPRPMLVDTYTISSDKLVYTFHLRTDVTFQDGSPMTSKDVVASLHRFLTVGATGSQVNVDVASLTAPDDHTVVLTLRRPRYPLLSELATTESDIFKASTVENAPATGFTAAQAIGTGPYELASYTPGQEIVLKRYAGYASRTEKNWGGFAGAKHAYIDTITFPFVTDTNAQVSGLQSGRWDFAEPSIDQYTVLKADHSLVVSALAGANLNDFATNQSQGALFSNPKAREALSLLIDRSAIDAAMGGNKDISEMTPAYVIKAVSRMFSTAGEAQYKAHDTKKAKELFAEAGVKPGDTIQILTTNTYPWLQQMAVLVQAELKTIGITAKINTYDWPTATKLAQAKTGWDIETVFYNAVSTSPAGLRILSGAYGTGFRDDELVTRIAAYNAARSDSDARTALDAMQSYLWQQYANVTVDITHEYAAYTPRLKGYGHFYEVFWNAWLAK